MPNDLSSLDFETPILELEKRIEELRSFQTKAGVDVSGEIEKLRAQCDEKKREIFSKLTPWQRVLLARHPQRPDVIDYLNLVFDDFLELHGDKAFGDDAAILTGLARIGTIRAVLVAQRKGKTTKERVTCNFGSPHPEGYRKALEKMKLAERFRLPVVTFVNTPGAYPGIGAEERGQATLIARNLLEMSRLRTPLVSVVIGEGGSGGALGICLADRLSILENAYLSVISPEGCAAILWRDSSKAPLAAELLRMTPQELKTLSIVDDILPEPLGGAHRDPSQTARTLKDYLVRTLDELSLRPIPQLLNERYEKYRRIGVFIDRSESKLEAARP